MFSADDEGVQYTLPDAAMFQLALHPPTSARQLLRAVRQAADALNQAVKHLQPYAASWQISSAVRRSAKHLVKTLSVDAFSSAGASIDSTLLQEAAAAAAAAPSESASSTGKAGQVGPTATAAGLLPLQQQQQQQQQQDSVGGWLHPRDELMSAAAAAAAGGSGKKKLRTDKESREFREKMIKKFSAKSQVGGVRLHDTDKCH
jgi:hypothetical protein